MELIDKLKKNYDILRASSVDISTVKTVNLIVGPYRNLTTLLGALLYLHPNIRVLNHAGERILNDERVDFIKNIDNTVFEKFIKYGIHISNSGERGSYGGSITKSHAFDDDNPISSLDIEIHSEHTVQALVWKESLRVVEQIRKNYDDIEPLLSHYPKLQFILPVRNPMDCANSNTSTGHTRKILNIDGKRLPLENMLDIILDEHLWVLKYADKYPERFHVIFQYEFTRDNFAQLGEFIKIDPTPSWLDAVEKSAVIKQKYSYTPEQWHYYKEAVHTRFNKLPLYQDKFLRFAEQTQ